jgi:hypothetical protein
MGSMRAHVREGGCTAERACIARVTHRWRCARRPQNFSKRWASCTCAARERALTDLSFFFASALPL